MSEDEPAASLPLSLLLIGAGRFTQDAANRALAERGDRSLRLMGALGHLVHEPGLSYSELARRAGVTAQSMQATVVQLERVGAVARATPAGRGRTAALHVTDEGHRMLGEMRQALAGLEEPLTEGLSAEERAVLTAALLRVAANAKAASAR
ncbi:MarR family transcriptional regulator [Streptomyces sp. AV19]|uniref:MarR family winged helix-turn-helix transcriptional regulator n=1 Tax=Streptomyces sp. AV19 TaxID=2793068 RepID=UPI0018FE96A7|nr:MarR family transcriptional regulator [Streptomyces sp. AV19]MBH1936888.1 MarR family transcriptional regulator [Streptomyces sp. AV19]MDG4532929.1 MarR family transcriptional regulator [Streptomyces sp. AV19]